MVFARRFVSVFVVVVLSLGIAPVWAAPQQTAEASVSAERAKELEKFGLAVDPGPDPDPTEEFIRFGKRYVIKKVDKINTLPSKKREGWIQPNHHVNLEAEAYREDADYVWFFWEVVEKERPRVKYRTNEQGKQIQIRDHTPEQLAEFRTLRPEFEELTPADSGTTILFEDASANLPTQGSWRNAASVADMNGDGHFDIVLPPQRSAINNSPAIFLGDGKGGWTYWEDAVFPREFAYGSVSVGDLNNDKKPDLVFGVHLTGIIAMLGDGKGGFVDASVGLPVDFPTRRVRLADLDRDGDLDLVAISEGPTKLHDTQSLREISKVRAYFNEGGAKSWKRVDVAKPERETQGDWMQIADVNGDKWPDIIGSSISFGAPDTMYLGAGRMEWQPFGRGFLPFYSYYYSVAVGDANGDKKDDAFVSFFRAWPQNIDPDAIAYPKMRNIVGIDRLTWTKKGATREPVARWAGASAVFAMASGDFNRDGKLDLVYSREDTDTIVLLLGDGRGSLRRATIEGAAVPAQKNYDITVADLNADGLDDLLVLYEADEGKINGLVKVLLNTGATPAGK